MTILVTGATGSVGRHVVARLREAGVEVRATSRDPGSAQLGAGVARADLTDPAALEPQLEGVDGAFLLWPFLSAERAPAIVEALARHAPRIVYLSAEAARQPGSVWATVEQLIEGSAAEWTFLRPTGFATNTRLWAGQIRRGNVVRWPYGRAARSLIHERDIAAVAVRALTGDGHAGARHVLSGPATVTQAEQVELIGEAIGRRVRWEDVPPEAVRDDLAAALGARSYADGALAAWAGFVDAPELVTTTVEAITGTPARSFRQWAADHAGEFR